ncbi:RPEL repeat protein [Penicillium mononematosum]|uniref:RPEL repeat protein n=1 Tax=Penicillium mononematosum TaxID=268346 RepID=UPI00254910DD|nr:RPEL repeat protein [Penicillium mononematosum]KAJ6185232.1 RPEL repeat protein [Penicillium mononematosum]
MLEPLAAHPMVAVVDLRAVHEAMVVAVDLKNRHILLDTNVAPALQSARQELDRQRATDSLKKNLEKRPDKDELVEPLQAHAQELKRHMLADNLEHKIQNRPQPEELISQGILSEDENPRSPV